MHHTDVLFSVSTVKDSAANIRRFVSRNLNHGVDHMIVFLDDDATDAVSFLAGHPCVTHVVTDDRWWRGERPASLNRRQVTNANVAKAVLTQIGCADWLFHIDGDEIVSIDRDRLESLPADTDVVHLAPMESVSVTRPARGPVQEFKRLLSDEELVLLKTLGAIGEADNRVYFHGHVGGKSGLRPRLDRYLGIHGAHDATGETCQGFEDDWLVVLHLESTTRPEFIRKWRNLATSGSRPRTRLARSELLTSVETLLGLGVGRRVEDRYLSELYEATTLDDVDLLRRLSLVERIDVDQVVHAPRELPRGVAEDIAARLARIAVLDKQEFRTGSPSAVAALLTQP